MNPEVQKAIAQRLRNRVTAMYADADRLRELGYRTASITIIGYADSIACIALHLEREARCNAEAPTSAQAPAASTATKNDATHSTSR